MIVYSINRYNKPINQFIATQKASSYRTILLFPMHTAEKKLELYLRKNYGLSLKAVCIQLWAASKVVTADSKIFKTIFTNKNLDSLAELITYGNSEVSGSNILKEAFS